MLARIVFALFGIQVLVSSQVIAENDSETGTPASPVTIGAILPLSGELSYFGEAVRRGIEMAREENGVTSLSVKYDDDRSLDRVAAIQSLKRLQLEKDLIAVIVSGMPMASALNSTIENGSVPAFPMWDSNNQIKTLSAKIFGFGYSNELTAELLAEYAFKEIGLKSIAVVSANDEWSEIMGSSFTKKFQMFGGQISYNQKVDLDQTDFRTLVAKMRTKNPDGVYFPLYGPSLTAFAKQVRDLGYKGAMLSAEGITENEISILGDVAEGMYITTSELEDRDFRKRYLEKFNLSKTDLNLAHVALGYDIFLFVSKLVEQLNAEGLAVTLQNVLSRVSSLKTQGVLGESSFGPSRIMERAQSIFQVKNGVLTRSGRLKP